MTPTPPDVLLSVVLCTWNNADRLGITLGAISECEVPEAVGWELVVVNNSCTDHTDHVVGQYSERLPVRLVHQPIQGLSHARNLGVESAKGRYIVFTDDDVRPYRRWIATYLDAFERMPHGHYFGGPLESEFEADPIDSELLRFAPWSVRGLSLGDKERPAGESERFVSANWACSKQDIVRIGGFDTGLGIVGDNEASTGEETDVMRRLRALGLVPVYLPGARIRHFVPKDKSSPDHIAGRLEAYGYYHAGEKYGADPGPLQLAQAVNQLVRAYGFFLRTRIAGRNWTSQHVKYRQALGETKRIVHSLIGSQRTEN